MPFIRLLEQTMVGNLRTLMCVEHRYQLLSVTCCCCPMVNQLA